VHRSLVPTLLIVVAQLGCVTKTSVEDDDTSAGDDDATEGPTIGLPASLPDAPLYEEYFTRLLPVGYAAPPLQWELVSGTLPAGIEMNADGELTGIATQEGTFDLWIEVIDADGIEGAGSISLAVVVVPESLYLGVWIEQVDPLCIEQQLLCMPWVRVQGAGEPQYERELVPALFHVGPDGNVDDAYDDDILYELLDPAEVTWSWEAMEWPTGDGTTLLPEDVEIRTDGTMVGGELTGGGAITYEHPTHGEGRATGYVVPPDWCPGWGC